MIRTMPGAVFLTAAITACARGSAPSDPPAPAPSPAPAPALGEILRRDMAHDHAMPWSAGRPLRWSDFQGAAPAAGEEVAKTAYGIYAASFRGLAEPCAMSDGRLAAEAQGHVDQEKATQRRYDAETVHGLRRQVQAGWEEQVHRWLTQEGS